MFVSRETNRTFWKIPLNTSKSRQPPRPVAVFPVNAGESSRFAGQLASCTVERKEERWRIMVCREKDFPCSHQLDNYSHRGVGGHKLYIWGILMPGPVVVAERCCESKANKSQTDWGLINERRDFNQLLNTVHTHSDQMCKNKYMDLYFHL